MTESQTEGAPPEGTESGSEAKTFDTEYVEKLRKEAAKYRTEAKANADAAKRLGEIEEAQKSAEQKAAEREAAATKRAEDAEARASRRDIAIEFGLPKDDAELLDGLTDEAAMRRLAERLAAKKAEQIRGGNVVTREGAPAGASQGSGPAADFAAFLGQQLGNN